MIVYEDDHIFLVKNDRGGDLLIVTFSELNFRVDGDRYWAKGPIDKSNISSLGVVAKSKNWFPEASMRKAIELISAFLSQFKTICSYGFSQGGYAAIKYSRLIGCDHVLSFSPQCSIKPDDVGAFDKRFLHYYDEEIHSNMGISDLDVGGRTWIFVDPHLMVDKRNSDFIQKAVSGVEVVNCNYLGHGTVRVVASYKSFSELIELIASDKINRSRLFSLIKRSKKDNLYYHQYLAKTAMEKEKFSIARYFIGRCRDIDPNFQVKVPWLSDLKEDQRRSLIG